MIFHMHQSFFEKMETQEVRAETFQSQRCSECNFCKNGKGTGSESKCKITDSQRLKDQNKTVLKMRKKKEKTRARKKGTEIQRTA